ncbi:hypothetical protein IQ37_15770 [Chryseobacterium piperi]|uniref:Uncharacterized protein n=1 Tax=Chryseobacterium piperi TaxID=558152 RepID=A0A086ATX9_9FLAO|nr:hypothetical protein CJF12_07910 [Chryseobacterium piperi]KFF20143.1 hypothetical protein IQ37_15770 [Chryseobacterium piperi]
MKLSPPVGLIILFLFFKLLIKEAVSKGQSLFSISLKKDFDILNKKNILEKRRYKSKKQSVLGCF